MNIQKISKKLELSADAIRYYEKEKLISIARDSSGYRDFSPANEARLETIIKLRQAGCNIAFLREYCALLDDSENHDAQQRQMLIEEAVKARKRLSELTEALDYLDWKINTYYRHAKILGDQSK